VRRTGNITAAAERARRLAELAQAIDRAQRLARSLAASEATGAEALELHGRLETARVEVEALRRGHWVPVGHIDPFWTSLLSWNGSLED